MTKHRTGLTTAESFSENGGRCTSTAVVYAEVALVSFQTARRVAFQLPQRKLAAKLASRDYIMRRIWLSPDEKD